MQRVLTLAVGGRTHADHHEAVAGPGGRRRDPRAAV